MRIIHLKKSRKQSMFSGRESAQGPYGPDVITFYYPDYTVGSGITPESCPLFAVPISQRGNCHCPKRLVGFTTDREFTCTLLLRAGVTLPRRLYSIVLEVVML